MTQAAEVKKGDTFWCEHKRLSAPSKGKIIALTDEPGKMIGVEFDAAVGGHTCDGRGKDGHCLWLAPYHIYTDAEWKDKTSAEEAALAARPKEFDKISLK